MHKGYEKIETYLVVGITRPREIPTTLKIYHGNCIGAA